MGKYKITWEGGELGIIVAASAESAIARFLERAGYGYMTPWVLAAELLCDSVDPTYPAGAPCAFHSGHRDQCSNGAAQWWSTGICADSPELPYLIAESKASEDDRAARSFERAIEHARRYRDQVSS